MEFEFTDEQMMLRKMLREFTKNEVAPRMKEMDENGFSEVLFKKMSKAGIPNLSVPEEYGGAGYDYITQAMAVYELSKGSPSIGIILDAHWKVVAQIVKYGTEEIKQKFLPRAKDELFAFCITEPSGGSIGSNRTTAVKDGDEWVLNGTKSWITNGGRASVYVILALTDKEQGLDGRTTLIADTNSPGFSLGKLESTMGMRGCPIGEAIMVDCRIPDSDRLGEMNTGIRIAHDAHDTARIFMGAIAAAIQDTALQLSIEYAKERLVYGNPIADLQAIQFKIAEIAMGVQVTKLIVYQSAYLKNQGHPHTREAATAKAFGSQLALRAADHAIQIFGGYGYSKEYPVEHLWRDAKSLQIAEGSLEKLHIDIADVVLSQETRE
ncbi:MAG: acyl-CoA dehydrogenase family protein [Desulforhabdus sp.]|jgi:alkylation response protein AidB-like acyl-CoA dehydrogenase|nr:acyl-CoA dehydrogenase family protein [Desulforhabdus sp.]